MYMYSYTGTTHCKQFCVPMSTRTLKSYKSLKCPQIQSQRVSFSKYPGGMLSDALAILYWHILRVHILTNSHININNINDDILGCASPSQ